MSKRKLSESADPQNPLIIPHNKYESPSKKPKVSTHIGDEDKENIAPDLLKKARSDSAAMAGQIKELQKKLAEKKQKFKAEKEKNIKLEIRIGNLNYARNDLENKLEQRQAKNKELKKEVASKNKEKEKLKIATKTQQQKIQTLSKQTKQVESQKKEWQKEAQDLRKKNKKIKAKKTEWKEKALDLEQENEILTKQLENLPTKNKNSLERIQDTGASSSQNDPSKANILKYLESIFGVSPSSKLLVNITQGAEESAGMLEVVGRAEVNGGTKQHRHITPHAFLTHAIKAGLEAPAELAYLMQTLSEIITVFSSNQEGICLREKDYKNLNLKQDLYSIKFTTNKDIYYLIDNGKEFLVTLSKIKVDRDTAHQLYIEKKAKFIQFHLDKLQEAVTNDNTLNIACDLLARFIYKIFNQQSVVSFADEGHSLNYEIRLYKSVAAAKNPSHNPYEVKTSTEIAEIIKEKGAKVLNNKIRIVNNEGDRIKKSMAALKIIESILVNIESCGEYLDKISAYNEKYNNTLKLENVTAEKQEDFIKPYNEQLKEDNLQKKAIFHIAKQLYFAFDFKPLEDQVFAPSTKNKGIQVFEGGHTTASIFYRIADGKKYRKDGRKSFDNKKVPVREEEVDKELLAQKLVDHTYLITTSFPYLLHVSKEENYSKTILKTLVKLISFAYEFPRNSNFYKDFVQKFVGNKFPCDSDNMEIDPLELSIIQDSTTMFEENEMIPLELLGNSLTLELGQ